MRTANGTVALFHSSATQWRHQFNLEVGCEKGSLILSGILSGSKSYGAETLTIAYRANNDMGDPREETRRYNQDPSWEMEINDFARLIETGDPVVNGSSLEALKTMELVYGIYSADANWRKEWILQD